MKTNYTAETDKAHKIKMDSHIIYTVWKSRVARGSSEAELEVRTSFVGEGAQIEVVAEGEDYGKLTKIKGKVFRNRFLSKVPIPKKVRPGERIWCTVKLPKHGLKAKSNSIPAAPPLELVRMQWSQKEVKRGDAVTIQAEIEGAADGTEAFVIIYEYDPDGNHDKVVTIPTEIKNRKIDLSWEYEYHDSTLNIATEKQIQKYNKKKHYVHPDYFFTLRIDGVDLGKEQESGLMRFMDKLNFRPLNSDGEPFADAEYILLLADGSDRKGTLDDEGYGYEKDLPPGEVTIVLPNNRYVFGK